MKILSNKKYRELLDKNENLALKNVNLTLDNDDKDAEIQIYNTQVNILLGKVDDLSTKLETKTKEITRLKKLLKENDIDTTKKVAKKTTKKK